MATTSTFVTRSFHDLGNTPSNSLFNFTILQWNVLADYLSTKESFPHVDPKVVEWVNRSENQLKIVLEHDYDFISLQEVDHYKDYLLPNLSKIGFKGLYKKKVGSNLDGSALFYRADRFELVDHELFEYGEGSHVAVLAHFLPKTVESSAKSGVCIVTTHLKAGLGFEKFRLKQMVKLIGAVKKFNSKRHWPVVLGMDGNDFPTSDVIVYATKGRVEHKKKVYETEYTLTSAYDLAATTGPTAVPHTTYKKRETEVLRTIDYILYKSTDDTSLTVTGLQNIPAIDAFPNRLPALDYPSDHLAIAAKFVVISKSDAKL